MRTTRSKSVATVSSFRLNHPRAASQSRMEDEEKKKPVNGIRKTPKNPKVRVQSTDITKKSSYELRRQITPTPSGLYKDRKTRRTTTEINDAKKPSSSRVVTRVSKSSTSRSDIREVKQGRPLNSVKPLKSEVTSKVEKPKIRILSRYQRHAHYNMRPLQSLFEQIDMISRQDGNLKQKEKPVKHANYLKTMFPDHFGGNKKNGKLVLKARGEDAGIFHMTPSTRATFNSAPFSMTIVVIHGILNVTTNRPSSSRGNPEDRVEILEPLSHLKIKPKVELLLENGSARDTVICFYVIHRT